MTLGRNYQRLWSATALSNLSDGMFVVALPLLALQITRSPAAIAGVVLAARLPWLVFALHAGALADRLDRRRIMLNVSLGRFALIGLLAVIAAYESEQIWVLYVAAFALGICETLFDTAAGSTLPMLVSGAGLSRGNSRLFAAEVLFNRFAGPPVGGFLVGIAITLAFLSSAVCYLLAALAIALMTGRFLARPADSPRSRLLTDIQVGLRYLWDSPLLRTLALLVGGMNLSVFAALSVLPVFAVDPGPMGLSPFAFGLLLSAGAVGCVIGAFSVQRLQRKVGRAWLLRLGVLAAAATCAAPLLTQPILVVGVLAVAGIGEMCWDVITVSLRQRIVPEHLIGRVNAGYRLVAYGSMPIGAAIGGVLGQTLGLRWVFAIGTLASVSLLLGMSAVSDRAMDTAEMDAAGST
ncbi:MFS transporter [Nocardioides agariphilus]|jgi:MFS family permease|uniref:MFS transporter n=1 Tax=Nocardioides agariphilus TaxID=433664 RepID=A0A930VPX5_9ACTN|nr:MFS transporter [Nocardioides agariphilus]MBF4768681.1 MFS transporter [Nocardioides agariphilus]